LPLSCLIKLEITAKSLESKSKTDPLDAAVITRFGLERQLNLWTPPSETMKVLRDLCREINPSKLTARKLKINSTLSMLPSSRIGSLSNVKLYTSNSSNGR